MTNIKEYDYRDEGGMLLYQVRTGMNVFGEKAFSVRRPNQLNFSDRMEPEDKRDWYQNMKDVRRVLYNLPALVDPARLSEVVWIVEGEKDAETLIQRGLLATTSFGGAGKWSYLETVKENTRDGETRTKRVRRDYSDALVGRDVIVIPDNGLRGRIHADQVWRSLLGKAARIRLLTLPGLPEKGDASDWLALGNTVEELARLADTIAVEIGRKA
jgi:hypothetical protein